MGATNVKAVFIDNKPVYSRNVSIQREICRNYGIDYEALDCRSEEDIIAQCQDADAILDIYAPITPRILDALPKCKVLVRFGIGYDVFDVDYATEKGIYVCNVPDYCTEEVATHTVALLLDVSRKVSFYNTNVKNGRWVHTDGYPMHRLSTQTVGFAGFGKIARMAASYLAPFGCQLIAYDPYLPEAAFAAFGTERVTLEELYARSDILSLHTPLSQATRHMINKDAIAKMKDGVLLVNTSRGPLICEDDLLEAVNQGKVAGAALDVVEFEPIHEKNYRLFDSGRIVVTPHAAFSSDASSAELLAKVAETACSVLTGDLSRTVMNRIVNRKQLLGEE